MSECWAKSSALLLTILLGVPASAADPAAKDATSPLPPEVQPGPRTPERAVTPAMKTIQQHRRHMARIKEGPIGVLFLGDLISARWVREGKVSWEKLAAYNPAAFGVGADCTEHVLWRITNGELDGKPKVVVLMIGTCNVGLFPDEKPEWTAAGIKKIIDTIHAKLPETKVLLLGIFPRDFYRNGTDDTRPTIEATNQIIAKFDDGQKIRYLDLGPKFLDANGKIPEDVMPDGLHLSAKGYAIWLEIIRPLLDEMMRP